MVTKFFATLVAMIITTVIVVGLFLAGSPVKERERRFDNERINDLEKISDVIDIYFGNTGRLPGSLDDLIKPEVARGYNIRAITDPETSIPYPYSTTSKTAYKLCAKFTLSSDEKSVFGTRMGMMYPTRENKAWQHPAGNKCFNLTSFPPKFTGISTNPRN